VRELGSQLLGKVAGNGVHDNGQTSTGQSVTLEQVAMLMPQLMVLVDRTLDTSKLKKQTVSQVLAQLDAQAGETDKPMVVLARQALELLPILAEMNFEDVYLRYATK
jgi:hypothetical protein